MYDMKLISKIYYRAASVSKTLAARCGGIDIGFSERITGKFESIIQGDGKINIGKNLMSNGPLYIKSVGSGVINIGSNCYFNHNCSLTGAEKINIGNNCMFANNLVIIDHDHVFDSNGAKEGIKSSPVNIGNNGWCGAGVTVLKGVSIGDGAVIAAGSVVTKDIPGHTLAAGVPAEVKKAL